MKSRSLTILAGGMISAVPYQGGWTWVMLQYLLGLKDLGYDVYFAELLRPHALSPPGRSLSDSTNAAYFRHVVSQFGLDRHSALVNPDTRETVGLSYEELSAVACRADVLLNVSGTLVAEELTERIPIRIYLDLDPGFTQLWQSQGIDMHLSGCTHFVTVGLSLGTTECNVPSCGIEWIPTLQPVVLKYWPQGDGVVYDGFTTIANWRGYGSIQHNGVFYGQKAHSLRQFIKLPTRIPEKFLLALSIHPDETKDIAELEANGWHILDPARVAATPALYREFIQRSKAEFGIAKSGYVAADCGWFSDRSICYLASGRPVIAQETGFSRFLPTGEGLFSFATEDEMLAASEALRSDYDRQARAARAIAVEYFDSRKVLSDLLRKVGAVES